MQLVIVGILITAAAAFIARATWKTWFGAGSKGCGSGCGKCATTPPPKPDGRFSLPQV